MPRLVIIADDFTGALDTGAQLGKAGIPTLVTAARELPPREQMEQIQVLVFDLESRHLPADRARELVRDAVRLAKRAGAEYLYKKTDSGLRGNIGAELDGLLQEGQGPVWFVPAFPATGRTTRNGYHYSGGYPVTRTAFGRDPFTPVLDDYIPDIIARQSRLRTVVLTREQLEAVEQRVPEGDVLILDAETDGEMGDIAEKMGSMGPPILLAGCAGFAAYLPELIRLTPADREPVQLNDGLVVVCGSINQTTLGQIDYARKRGFSVVELRPEQKLETDLPGSPQGEALVGKIQEALEAQGKVILQASSGAGNVQETDRMAEAMGLTKDATRLRIAENIGGLIGKLSRAVPDGTIAVFGGDTLMAVMRSIGGAGILPVCEIESGVVLSTFCDGGATRNLITKSGGFGGEDIIVKIEQFISSKALTAGRRI